MAGKSHDFSQTSIDKLATIVNDVEDDGQWGWVDGMGDWTISIPELKEGEKSFQNHYQAVIDKHNIGKSDFDTILKAVEFVDFKYEKIYTTILSDLKSFNDKLETIGQLITPSVMTLPQEGLKGMLSNLPYKKIDFFHELGLTTDEVNNLLALGYNIDEIMSEWDLIKNNEKDKEFFIYFLKRQYSSAFNINPDVLSDDMKTILANHLAKLVDIPEEGPSVTENKLTELENIVNSLIRNGDGGDGEKYMVSIAASSDLMATQITSLMLTVKPESETYTQLEKLFNQYNGLYNLMIGISAIPTPANGMFVPNDVGYNDWYYIQDLTIDQNGQLAFNLMYSCLTYSAIKGNNIADAITTFEQGETTITNQGAIGGYLASNAAGVSEMLKAKEELLEKTIINIFGEGVGILNPAFKLEANLIQALNKDDYASVSKDLVSNLAGKFTTKGQFVSGIASIGKEIWDYRKDYSKLDTKESVFIQRFVDAIVNNGGISVDVDGGREAYALPGISNIDSIRAMREIEESGVTNFLSKDEVVDLNRILDKNGLNSAEEYLLGIGNHKLSELNVTELNAALNQLGNCGNGDKTIDGFIDWLKVPSNYGGS
ncbi:hypothetical protein [Listeria booriae]|uniref:hypothetical protein n=1 Tax=Listeria booriae TaxID=1552123 RepID=UPI0016250D71|nr:hypothetical protein [Listeria booriae]MBC2324661.1 hypothetical protein [Listeria booriae]